MAKKNLGSITVIVLAIASTVAILIAGYLYFFGRNLFFNEPAANNAKMGGMAHFYKDPQTSISKIVAKVFYVLPENRKSETAFGWDEPIKTTLEKISKFHTVQLRGLSNLRYDVFPKPVILEQDESFYNTTSTAEGNPRGLVSIAEEIDRRVFRPEGDLYDPDFARFEDGEYPVMGLIYEGVGASGGVIYETKTEKTKEEIAKELGVPESIVYIIDVRSVKGFFLLNHEFLRRKEFSIFGPTFLYHEFAHAYGLPDRGGEMEQSNDIMGLGRRDPIEVTYIDSDVLEELGIISK